MERNSGLEWAAVTVEKRYVTPLMTTAKEIRSLGPLELKSLVYGYFHYLQVQKCGNKTVKFAVG